MTIEDYDSYDALGLAGLVRRGEVSASELLEEAIRRAAQVNPRLNAIVTEMHSVARERARAATLEGPFAGVPFLLKDLSGAHEGVRQTGGSRVYRGYVSEQTDLHVERFLDAGVVIFAKTNTPEFGILPTTEPELFGPTHNPWRHGHTPGGSSGGSAAAVAAGVVPMAHGGDGGGSIRIPASCCGIYGLKPSRQRTPLGPNASEGFFGFSISHVLTRSVRDSAAMLDATCAPEPHAIFFAPPGEGFSAALERPPGRLRIAYSSAPLMPADKHLEATRAVEDAAKKLEALGHHVEEASPTIQKDRFAKAFFHHFAAGVASELLYAEQHMHRPVGPADVENSTWLLSLVGRAISGAQLALDRRVLFEEARRVVGFFDDYDIFLSPVCGKPPIRHGGLEPDGLEGALQGALAAVATPSMLRVPGLIDRAVSRAYGFAPYTMVFNVTGQPSASVPLYWTDDGLPMGAMITARPGADALLLQLSAQLEAAHPWFDRRPAIRAT